MSVDVFPLIKTTSDTFYSWDFISAAAFGLENQTNDGAKLRSGLKALLRFGAILGHIPWTLPLYRLVPGANKGRIFLDRLTNDWLTGRLRNGSTNKDMFFHMVSCIIFSYHVVAKVFADPRRRCARSNVRLEHAYLEV